MLHPQATLMTPSTTIISHITITVVMVIIIITVS